MKTSTDSTDYTEAFNKLLKVEQLYEANTRHIKKYHKLIKLIPGMIVTILVILTINFLNIEDELTSKLLALAVLLGSVISTMIWSKKNEAKKLEKLERDFQEEFLCPSCKGKLYEEGKNWIYWKEKKGCDNKKCKAKWTSEEKVGTTLRKVPEYWGNIILGAVMVIFILGTIFWIVKPQSEYMAKVVKDGMTGYIDKKGKEKIPFYFHNGLGFGEGLAPVIQDSKWVYIDVKENKRLINTYDFAIPFSQGRAAVKKDKKWGFIDKNGQEITGFKYCGVKSFCGGLAAVSLDLQKWGFVDTQGKMVIQPNYDYVGFFSEGLAFVQKHDFRGWIDKNEELLIPSIYVGGDFSDNLAKVQRDNDKKWGYLNRAGKQVIDFRFEDAGDFSEGRAAVFEGGKWGYIDKNGENVIGFRYEEAFQFSNGLAVVKYDGKYGYIDTAGEKKIDYKFDFAGGFKKVIFKQSKYN